MLFLPPTARLSISPHFLRSALPPRSGDVNTTADGDSRLGNPVVVARAEETNLDIDNDCVIAATARTP